MRSETWRSSNGLPTPCAPLSQLGAVWPLAIETPEVLSYSRYSGRVARPRNPNTPLVRSSLLTSTYMRRGPVAMAISSAPIKIPNFGGKELR